LLASAFTTPGQAQEGELPTCFQAWGNSNGVPVGHKCVVSTGDVYQRVNRPGFSMAWKDLRTGLIWSDQQLVKGARFSYFDDAWDHCAAMKAHLPMPEDCVDINTHVQWFPMKWVNLYSFYSSKLDDFQGQTIELGARYCSGYRPELSNSRNCQGSYGGTDRRYKSDIYTICVDDFEVIKKRAPQ
jgi:hypothetical protein